MTKKIDQVRLNKVLTVAVILLAIYSIILTWWGVSAHLDAKRSLEFLYSNVEFRAPSN
jgi:hypothetical protein